MLTSLLAPQSFPEGLFSGVGAASEGVEGVLGADPDSPLFKRALTSDFARRSRSAAPENRPTHHSSTQSVPLHNQHACGLVWLRSIHVQIGLLAADLRSQTSLKTKQNPFEVQSALSANALLYCTSIMR